MTQGKYKYKIFFLYFIFFIFFISLLYLLQTIEEWEKMYYRMGEQRGKMYLFSTHKTDMIIFC